MTSFSVALPRARTKRRRRKPMPPWLKFYLVMVVLLVISLASAIVYISLHRNVLWNMLLAALDSFWLTYYWPWFKREWEAWRRDDD